MALKEIVSRYNEAVANLDQLSDAQSEHQDKLYKASNEITWQLHEWIQKNQIPAEGVVSYGGYGVRYSYTPGNEGMRWNHVLIVNGDSLDQKAKEES